MKVEEYFLTSLRRLHAQCEILDLRLPKVKFSWLERLYQTPKKWQLAFQKYKLSNSFFKMQLQNCVFPNFNLQILSSKSNLRSSFTNLFNFKFSKTCWKSPKLYKKCLTNFEEMRLAAFVFFYLRGKWLLQKHAFHKWQRNKDSAGKRSKIVESKSGCMVPSISSERMKGNHPTESSITMGAN